MVWQEMVWLGADSCCSLQVSVAVDLPLKKFRNFFGSLASIISSKRTSRYETIGYPRVCVHNGVISSSSIEILQR
jgi:hypothetical protein